MSATRKSKTPAPQPEAAAKEEGVSARLPRRSDVKDRLLDTAELLFAELGYAACTFRVISDRSGINQGLLHYYFSTKVNLFSEVFLRRAQTLSDRRTALLDEAEALHGEGGVPVEALVRAFIEPTLRMAEQGPGGRAFLRIHSQLRTEPGELGLSLRRQAFGRSTARFVRAMQQACPHLPKKVVHWRFNFMIGTYLVVTAHSGRLEDYSGGTCSSDDVEDALTQILSFVSAGFKAAAPARGKA